jgi:tetratricopeptide (TPR) repeat protein
MNDDGALSGACQCDIPILSGYYSIPENQLKKCLNHIRRAHFGHVIAITGQDNICGVGKSTFAAKLAVSVDTKKHFQFGIIWVRVGHRTGNVEHIALLQHVASQIVENAVRIMSLEETNRDELMTRISPSDNKTSVADCIAVMQTVFVTLKTKCGTSDIPKCLVIFDDVFDDQLVRYLQHLDIVMLVTTRFAEMFSGEFPGTIYFLEAITVEQKTKVLCNAAGLYQQTTSLPPLALEVLETCRTIFEVDMCSHLLSTRMNSDKDLEKILRRRREDLSHSGHYTAWIINEAEASWHNLNLMHHVGTLGAMAMCYEQLDAATQQQYLTLSLCPAAVTLTQPFLMMLLNLPGSTEFNAIIGSLTAKHMLICVQTGGPDSPKLYHLHYLQWVFLKLVVLQSERRQATSFFCFSFGQSAPRTDSERPRDVFEALEDAADRLVAYITSAQVVTGTSLLDVLPMWRTLAICGDIGILSSFEGPLVYLQRTAQDLASVGLGGGGLERCLVDYVIAASAIVEQLDEGRAYTDAVSMKKWYAFALAAVEVEERRVAGGSATAARNALLLDISQHRATIMNKLGVIFCQEGQLKFALDYHLEALSELQKKGRPTTTHAYNEISGTFACIANIYIARKAYDEAAHIIQSVIKFNEGLHGLTHKDNAASWCQLGDIYSVLERYSDSLFAYDTAFHIYTVCAGAMHVDTIVAEAAKSVAMIKSGDPDNGIYALRRCIQLLVQQDFSTSDPKFLSFVEYLPEDERAHFTSNGRDHRAGEGGRSRAVKNMLFCGLISACADDDYGDNYDSDEEYEEQR